MCKVDTVSPSFSIKRYWATHQGQFFNPAMSPVATTSSFIVSLFHWTLLPHSQHHGPVPSIPRHGHRHCQCLLFWLGFETIPPAHAPYTVALTADPNGRVTCVGHLIAPSVVLTTASCLAHSINFAAVEASVILNTTNTESIQVAHTVVHPAFDAVTHANDVGLIQLAHPSAAAPAAFSWDVVDANEAATLRGWGQLGDGTKVNNGLMETSSSVWANTDCAFVYAKVASPNSISHSVLCAGGETAQACVGDAGDALTIFDGTNARRRELHLLPMPPLQQHNCPCAFEYGLIYPRACPCLQGAMGNLSNAHTLSRTFVNLIQHIHGNSEGRSISKIYLLQPKLS
ncbi:Aste57867_7892 [Aphanomyces stellatus]|uniref:Aste57867_7892 protein n=1 Tax=Aphanomyces stellatus TaxID=120398 RepID=A0A485KIY2_9STRA|nr:hypothetical protein As57867_007862 [Aphanomyces stellatus]VFT84785.1 Aste57867_7892 [Aphanomyces stellatus]